MILHNGLLLSFFAVFLQIAVFLQPLLPEKFQISPVCETITLALLASNTNTMHSSEHHSQVHDAHLDHSNHVTASHDHHDASHHCQYCTVYANLVLPPTSDIQEVFLKIQVQYIWLQQQFEHIYFALQRLYLTPQGRAPPSLV